VVVVAPLVAEELTDVVVVSERVGRDVDVVDVDVDDAEVVVVWRVVGTGAVGLVVVTIAGAGAEPGTMTAAERSAGRTRMYSTSVATKARVRAAVERRTVTAPPSGQPSPAPRAP
jgi:hypothetical protein